ncbi:MAG TPA: RHS repeat-associated core domain-containing protein [Fimbriimonadaceae bacterium]|nr:RHS repeat-associated core domain-containing protein [Fimbriimonadaceae bacterium]
MDTETGTTLVYDRNSRLSRKTLHDGTDVVYGYDNRSRPTSINMEEDGEAIIWQSLGYDAASNITSHTINLVTTNYTYDDINQLLSEARTGHNTSYTYDGNGNRTQRVINGVTETYSYDNGDKLTSVTWTGGSKTYGYDNAGRLTSVTTGGVTTNLGYDHDNRVTSISRSGMTTNTFVYNGFGTRTSKTDSTGTRTYLRDGVGVTSPVLSDGAGTYTPGISERRGTTSTYQLNGLKNTFAQSDANGGHVSSRNYDAFGAVTSSSGTHQGPFGYGGPYGYQTDPDTGLMLLGHRFFDPSVGRFLTRDPIKDGRNWYGYGGGYSNPVNGCDPDGLEWHDPLVIYVDPEFKGRVIVVGEPGQGKEHVWVEVMPGYHSNGRMDVDYVKIIQPNGKTKILFAPGLHTTLNTEDHWQYGTVDRSGYLDVPGPVLDYDGLEGRKSSIGRKWTALCDKRIKRKGGREVAPIKGRVPRPSTPNHGKPVPPATPVGARKGGYGSLIWE